MHIGDMVILFLNVTSLMVKGENNAVLDVITITPYLVIKVNVS
jgi:hypothetical protein